MTCTKRHTCFGSHWAPSIVIHYNPRIVRFIDKKSCDIERARTYIRLCVRRWQMDVASHVWLHLTFLITIRHFGLLLFYFVILFFCLPRLKSRSFQCFCNVECTLNIAINRLGNWVNENQNNFQFYKKFIVLVLIYLNTKRIFPNL